MKQNRSWMPIDIFIFEHEVFQSLTDTQKCAYLLCIAKSKQLRRGGEFTSRKHLGLLLGSTYARSIPRLIAEGLLEESQGGLVTISNYSQWQVDVTSAERQARYRAQKASGSRNVTTVYGDINGQDKKKDTLTNSSRMIPLSKILGGQG